MLPVDQAVPGSAVPSRPRARARRGAERVFLDILEKHISDESLTFAIRDEQVRVGNGSRDSGLGVRVHNDRFFGRALSGGNLGMGESYMDGDWDMMDGDIADFLTVLLRNRLDRKIKGDAATALKVARVQFENLFRKTHWGLARFHYDHNDEIFESVLDTVVMGYSCGYAETPADSAEQLQINKLNRICRKLDLKPGDHILDIGCGFGGMMIHAATHYGVTGVGITTSRHMCEFGNKRITQAGLSDRVHLELRDHRTVDGTFDKVVSMGMFEHLPRKEYDRFFERIAAVLPPHGRGLVQTVGCATERNLHDPFTQKYMLPGTSTPKLSELADCCERKGLAIWDVENFVRHYDYTAASWLGRLRANKDQLDQKKYDVRFQRMWEYYLSGAIAGARASDATLYQVLFARDYSAPMPLHRV